MAVSVLGKRTRRTQDTEVAANTSLPPRKRRTRCQSPQIYEDVENHSKPVASATTRTSPSKRVERIVNTKHTISTANIEHSQWERTELQDENTPPSITATPTTNRIKNVLGLHTPSTPKHRVRLAGTALTPRTPKTAPSSPRPQSVFATARQLFTQSSSPHRLVGRDGEREKLHHFITDAVTARAGGCMYVSGPPGTGKSALVHEVFQTFESHENVEISIINCVGLRSANDIYGKLLHDFAPDASVGKTSLKQYLSKLLLGKSKSRSRLLLLDEVDSLLDVDCEILYTIFEWAMHHSSSLILVGIANALDLTDRFLPRLKTRGLRPDLLPFLPYTAAQISNIISDKLRSLLPPTATADKSFVPFMQPVAVQLCGKKIASQTGDLRKAFSLVRRVLDQLERESTSKEKLASPSKSPLGEISNIASSPTPAQTPSKIESKFYSIETAPRASIAHVARVASLIFNNGTITRLAGLNLQQKAVLCSLVSGESRKAQRDPYITPSKSTNRIPTVKDLFAKYTILCKRDEGLLHPLKDTEFRDVVASLETLGLIHEQKGRSSSLLTPTGSGSRAGRSSDDKQIVSAVSEKEMRDSLEGAGADLLRRLLDES